MEGLHASKILQKSASCGLTNSWKALCEIKQKVEKNIIWLPREEKLSFWYNDWTKKDPLYKHLPSDVKPRDVLLRDVLEENSWQYEKIEDEIPYSVKNIVDQQHLILLLGVPEKVIWTTNSTGVFSVASAWNCLRQRKNQLSIFTKIWNKHVPLKMAFMSWTGLMDRVPTDEKIAKIGYNRYAICYCCYPHSIELKTAEHLFCSGSFAQVVWKRFAGPCGILMDGMQLMQVVHNWWNHKTTNIIASFMVKLLLALIIWKLWRSRCAYRYENGTPLVCRSESLISNKLSNLTGQKFGKVKLKTSWNQIQKMLDQRIRFKTYRLVKWVKPPISFAKLNSDGSCVEGNCSMGGVIRYDPGNFILAYSSFTGTDTKNSATPWRIAQEIEEIKKLVHEENVGAQHCFK
ncbi:PREDICTED: uncharacterized protein LOC109241123 [Nicotiana attenuata]|uniref:uncharacterized protein LOC109241123 n=1 Tax=Nicotiana attenuata TaxID=49451 RepID=UPI000905563A|nr:PREDICTED: uncharacterized protein LOC109241123 [Nicotiana attenuata]